MLFKRAPRTNTATAHATGPGLKQRLVKSRGALARGLGALFGRSSKIDDSIFDELEEFLITADLGVRASQRIVDTVRDSVRQHRIGDPDSVMEVVRGEMVRILQPCAVPIDLKATPHVILVVGVNGVGKTTTIAKLARRLQTQGRSVLLAAADTFRAAAVDQLKTWGERLAIQVVDQGQGADAAAVAHDAVGAARARGVDVLIVDTAGRQHTQSDLMEQLKKVKRVVNKLDPTAPHQVLQVLDAGTGQNALSQLEHFHAAVGVTGMCITKLDGTAKGGVLFSIAEKFRLPIHYIGVGEGYEDLREFDPAEFVEALVPSHLDV